MNKLYVLVLCVLYMSSVVASNPRVLSHNRVSHSLPKRIKTFSVLSDQQTNTPATPTPSPAPGSGWNTPFNGTVCPSGQVRKSRLATFLLSFFAGGVAVDRFYTGYIWQGVLKLIFPTGGIWWLVDVILYGKGDLPNADGCSLYPDM
jgi:hypothetical protein